MVDTALPLLLLIGVAGLILRDKYEHRNRKRNNFPISIQKETLKKQNGRCAMCRRKLTKYTTEFHHRDGNRSNNKASNCEAVCSNCHSIKTRTKLKSKPFIRW